MHLLVCALGNLDYLARALATGPSPLSAGYHFPNTRYDRRRVHISCGFCCPFSSIPIEEGDSHRRQKDW